MALRTLQFRLKFDNIFVSLGQNASFALNANGYPKSTCTFPGLVHSDLVPSSVQIIYLSLFGVIVGAVGYDLGDFVDPSVDFVASSPLDFVVLLPPRQVLLNPAS